MKPIAYCLFQIGRQWYPFILSPGRLVTLSFCLLLLAACVPKGRSEPQPPEIAYGLDVCEACGMLISEARFAAATLLTDGQTHKFDDIGNMLVYHMDHPEQPVEAWFVHDYHDETWLRGEGAFYVMDSQILSPMGHGIAAFAKQEAAANLAGELGASVLTFDELRAVMHIAVHSH